MNSNVEKFAFGLSIFITFVYPALLVLALIGVAVAMGDGEEGETVVGLIVGLNMLAYVIVFPIMFIVFSHWIERIHFRSLETAERELADMTVSDMKTLPPNWNVHKTFFVCENVVVANDYLKRLFWSFRKIVGGHSRAYEKLVERARREATVRLLRKARHYGANVVWNVRYETSTVYTNTGGDNKKSMAGMEMLAYGTAFFIEN